MAPQLDLFAPKPQRVEWRDGEERGVTGRIGTATIAIRVNGPANIPGNPSTVVVFE